MRYREDLPELSGDWHYLVRTPDQSEVSHWGTCSVHQQGRLLQFTGRREGETQGNGRRKGKQHVTERFWKTTWSEICQDGFIRASYDVTLTNDVIKAFFTLSVGKDRSMLSGDYF